MSNIETIQQGLESALQRAAMADDRELAGRVRDEGRRLVFLLNGLMRLHHLYDSENAAFDAPSREFAQVLRGLIELLGAVHIICVEDQIYVSDIRLRINPTEQPVIDSLVSELGHHGVGGISFHSPLEPATVKQLAQALANPPDDQGSPRAALAARLAGLSNFELVGMHRFRLGGEQTVQQQDYRQALKRGESVVREALQNLAADRVPNPLPVRRAVIDLVNNIREDPKHGLEGALRKRQGSIGEQHLLAVSSLAILLGQTIGLPESALSDLGVAAMLHDAGYTQDAARTGHEAVGAGMLLKQRGFHEAKIRRLLAVLEHHTPYRRESSFPSVAEENLAKRPPSLFARILHIVDDYDVLTSERPGQPPPLAPATALAAMWSARGHSYDPDLLDIFTQLVGRYPPGTLLELSDGRWAISASGGRDQQRYAWPIVRIVREADGAPADASEEVDLYELSGEVRVRRVLEPQGS